MTRTCCTVRRSLFVFAIIALSTAGFARQSPRSFPAPPPGLQEPTVPPRAPDYDHVLLSTAPLPAEDQNWQPVEAIFGRKGTIQGSVLKFSFPRSDLKVKVGSVALDPGLALGSWAAFAPAGKDTMAMGDLVLLEKEIAPAMKAFVENGIEISALHNHIAGESPRVMYMHFEGHGTGDRLARAIKSALQKTRTPLGPPPPPKPGAADWGKVESMLGHQGRHAGMLLQVSVPRAGAIQEGGMDIPPFMGMAIAINMQMAGKKAATTGDFVLTADEVNPVIQALTQNGIAVTAIHNHMLNETPRIFFMHFWGYDAPETLAHGLRAALEKTAYAGKGR